MVDLGFGSHELEPLWRKYAFFKLTDYFDASAIAKHGNEENLRADIQELMLPAIEAKQKLKRRIETHHNENLAGLVISDESVYRGAREVIDAMSEDMYAKQTLEAKLKHFEGCLCHISLAQDLVKQVIEDTGLFDVEIDGEIVDSGLALLKFYKKYEELFGRDFAEKVRAYARQAMSDYCAKFSHIEMPQIVKKPQKRRAPRSFLAR